METINFQNKRWIIKYQCNDEGQNSLLLNTIKEYRQADQILKRNNTYFFVEEIPDIKFQEI